MVRSLLVLLAICGVSFAQGLGARPNPQLEGCVIKLVDDIEIPATEPGVLTLLSVREGSLVKAEDVIGTIDDREAQMAKQVASLAWKSAKEKSKDDVEIRYAQAASLVAEADWKRNLGINDATPGAVPLAEVEKSKLEYDRAALQIEKAGKDLRLAGFEADTKLAEYKAAELAIERRHILAPFDGEVLEVKTKEKEWVNPGDSIVRLARLDLLKVEGYVYLAEYELAELRDCEVVVTLKVGPRDVEATGRVVNIDPEAANDGGGFRYMVTAEITNRKENGEWLLLPGLQGTMTIKLGTAAAVGNR